MRKTISPAQLAKLWGVGLLKIHGFIKRGELRAINFGAKSLPRWRIPEEAVEDFELRRSNVPPPAPKPKPQSEGVREFV